MAPKNKISAVLPLKLEKHKTDSLEQCILLFESYLQYGQRLFFDRFLIVSPKTEIAKLKIKFGHFEKHLPLEYIDENLLISYVNKKPWVSGWRKQQLIKLAVSTIMNTEYYITFDADVLFKKNLANDDLFADGKAIIHMQSKMSRPKWWNGSAKILNVAPNLLEVGMGVTPAILHTKSVRNLLEHLSDLGKCHWIRYLLKTYKPFPVNLFIKYIPWTEYSLYFYYLKDSNLLEKVHDTSNKLKLVSNQSVWNRVNFQQWDVNSAFNDSTAAFLVIQSNKSLSINEIKKKIQPYINSH